MYLQYISGMKNFLFFFFIIVAFNVDAQVTKNITVANAGSLSSLLTTVEKSNVTNLTISGNLDARDFKTLRDELTVLQVLDISSVAISAYNGSEGTYPASWGSATYSVNSLPQYSFNKDVIIGKQSLKIVVLPESVTSIGHSAFKGCSNLTDVNLPVSLTRIENDAFYECTKLMNLTIPDYVSSIGSSAYQFCHSLTIVTLGSSVNEIGNQAFYECHNLKIINSRNSTPPVLLGDPFAFTYLSMVYVPSLSISSYRATAGWKAFNIGSSNLITINNTTAGSLKAAFTTQTQVPLSSITKLKVNGPLNSNDIYLIRDSLKILMEVDLSGATLASNLLPSGAFQGKGILVSAKLPDTVTAIGDNAFNSCVNLSTCLPLPASLTTIGNAAFYNCKLMTGNLMFPSNLQTVGNNAFDGCRGLTGSFELPPNIVTIGSSAFKDCTGLTGSLSIPPSVVSLGSYAFQNCSGLNGGLVISANISKILSGTFASCTGITGSLVIPASVTSIDGSAFVECSKLTELTLSKNLSSIGDEAFYSCTGLTKINSLNAVPPAINLNTFGSINTSTCQLKVPVGAKSAYQ